GAGGNDSLDGRGAADELWCGDGSDTVDYSSRTARVFVTLDGNANDGEAGEHDYARDCENVVGGSGNDHLTGNAGDSVLDGGGGGEGRVCGGGNDTASDAEWGRTAPVTVRIDKLANDGEAGEGDNVRTDVENLVGGGSNDTLVGSDAGNQLSGLDGNDVLDG